MAYVSDITNQFGNKEEGSTHAPVDKTSILVHQTEDDPLDTYEPDDTIQDDDYGHVREEKSELPKHLFDSAKAEYDRYKQLSTIQSQIPREYPRGGITKDGFYTPYKYIPIYPQGFSSDEPDMGTIVKMPPVYKVSPNDEHAWDCGCLPDAY